MALSSLVVEFGNSTRQIYAFASLHPYITAPLLVILTCLLNRVYSELQYARIQARDNPKEPATLPYWIPFLGHVISYISNNGKLTGQARDHCRDSIYTIRLLHRQHYMITTPSIVQQIFKQRATTLSNKPLIHRIARNGFRDEGTTAEQPDLNAKITDNLHILMTESAILDASDRTAKAVGKSISLLTSFSSIRAKQTAWERGANPQVTNNGKTIEADMFHLVTRWAYTCSTPAMFGQSFLKRFPDVMDDLFVFDGQFPFLLAGVPAITGKIVKAKAARDRCLDAMKEWFEALTAVEDGGKPRFGWGDMGDVSELMRIQHRTWRSGGPQAEKAAISSLLSSLWGLHANSNIIAFWTMLHIYENPTLLASIRAEVSPYITRLPSREYTFDHSSLSRKCPILKSTWYETMRWDLFGAEQKYILRDFCVTESAEDATMLRGPSALPRSYTLKAGNVVCIHNGATQKDPKLWENPEEFNPRRFIVQDSRDKTTEKAEMFRHLYSFGGGYSMCKGRLFAEREVLTFVAAVVSLWDMEFLGDKGQDGRWVVQREMDAGAPHPDGEVRVRRQKQPPLTLSPPTAITTNFFTTHPIQPPPQPPQRESTMPLL
ncbi:cytochrome P450 [Aspergillus heteromorphus CBS 117.55]|uniref:Cytochrome P450 n=1 Tax=Aspergillus heteromorphus CBS 117.55 TaxID=1448321 RepID=A0A317WSX4_9EURO|nr:cytochrome P450 [Aspergillus heteromorphus CBS 117.55]PWY88392.1 cytochrome P450 [Aspergillus heteromorphus CBS 117.55]